MMPRPARRGRSSAGFSLLEVIVAFLILTLGMIVLARSASLGVRNAASAQAMEAMLELASGLVDRVLAGDPTLEPAGTHDRRLSWRIETRPFESRHSGSVSKRLRLEEITVTVEELRSGRELRLQRIRLRPAGTAPGLPG